MYVCFLVAAVIVVDIIFFLMSRKNESFSLSHSYIFASEIYDQMAEMKKQHAEWD